HAACAAGHGVGAPASGTQAVRAADVELRPGQRAAAGESAMIGCDEAMRRLWEYLDGTVEVSDLAKIEDHLAHCLRCCGERDFAKELRRFLASCSADELPDDVAWRLNQTVELLGRGGVGLMTRDLMHSAEIKDLVRDAYRHVPATTEAVARKFYSA